MTIGRFTVMSIHTYIRRYTLFLTGVILSATGIAFITRRHFASIRSSVCSEPDHQHFHGNLHVFIQYDVPDAGSHSSQEIYHPAGSADSGDILFQLLH